MPLPQRDDHSALIVLAVRSHDQPILSIRNTSPDIFKHFTLDQLDFYLSQCRGYAVNATARWRRTSPPGVGRAKRDGLLEFAIRDYQDSIQAVESSQRQFDDNVMKTFQRRVQLWAEPAADEADDIFSVFLRADDIEYVQTLVKHSSHVD